MCSGPVVRSPVRITGLVMRCPREMEGAPHGGSPKQKAALAAAPDAMKRQAALSEGQPPKRDNDHRAFHGGLPRPCADTGQHVGPGRTIQGSDPGLRFMNGPEPLAVSA